MKRKKICYITTLSSTIRAFFVPQLKYLAKNGYDVTIICNDNIKIMEKFKGTDIHIINVDFPRGISLRKTIISIITLIKLFSVNNYDLVQYSTPNAAFYASIASYIMRIKIRNYHCMGFRYLGAKGIGRFMLKCFEKITCACSTHIECVSQSNLTMGVNEHLFSEKKAIVVWNGSTGGVDLKKFDYSCKAQWRNEVREELGISEKDIVLGFAGRITKDKGINELIEAFSMMENSAKLLLIGSPEGVDTLNPKLWNWANNSSNVIIHDTVTDIERYFAAMDVLVLPSYREGFGNVIIEAEAMGIPVVVTAIPGPIDTMIQDKTGLCCNVMDVEDLYEKLKVMVEDDTLRSQMGNEAYKYVSTHFDSEVLCQKILDRKKELFNKEC